MYPSRFGPRHCVQFPVCSIDAAGVAAGVVCGAGAGEDMVAALVADMFAGVAVGTAGERVAAFGDGCCVAIELSVSCSVARVEHPATLITSAMLKIKPVFTSIFFIV